MKRCLPIRITGTTAAALAATLLSSATFAGTNVSEWAFIGSSGTVLYRPGAMGNRLLDYSAVGYRNGTAPIPVVPVKITLSPQPGDNGSYIQGAINYVKALPLDTNGFRGAVLFNAGEYPIAGSITIDGSGVVLRGSGDGTNGTILRGTGTTQRTLLNVRGSGSASTVSGTTHNIIGKYVPVGAFSFLVDSTSGLAVGDRVMVRRIATDQWIKDLGMDLLGPGSGGDADDVPWTASGYHMDFDRIITRIEGNRITIDAPITCAIEARYAGGTIRKYTWPGRINNVGIENIRGVSDYAAADDEAHAWTFIGLSSVENAWVQNVTSRYFGYACVALGSGARTVTVQDCSSLDPVSIVTGGRRYAFVMDDAQLCLVRNCYTQQDRHQFVTQSLTTGPNVFVDGVSDSARSDAGPHHRWGTGALWDNIVVNGNSLNVQNRGNLGTGHGWAGANEVVWNSTASGGYVVQNPPGAHNWLIGSVGAIKNGTVWVGPHAPGSYDSHGSNVFPNCLYYAQLQNRLSGVKVEGREYMVGQIDDFEITTASGTTVPLNATWRSAVENMAAGQSVNGFDIVTNNQYVPFTFNFALAANERVASASLALAMRSASNSTSRALFIDSTTNVFTFAQLGWKSPGSGTNTTVSLLDLQAHLEQMADGTLNLAVGDDVGIDWAILLLQVVPRQTLYTNSVEPAADASVRNGIYATINYGTNTTMEVKADASANARREAVLRWNLSGYSGPILHARLRLTPLSTGTNGIEHSLAASTNTEWNETAVNWNSQPASRKRFATWIPAANVPVEIMVTPQVQEAMAGDGRLGFELSSLKDMGAPGLVTYASAEHPDPSMRPQLLLVTSNAAPRISVISDRGIRESSTTGPIPFEVSDPIYSGAELAVGAGSSNENLVPGTNIWVSGTGTNRAVTITPLPGQVGQSSISITVTNPLKRTAATTFTLMVTNQTVVPVEASGSWMANGSGGWESAANWNGGIIARGTDNTAFFSNDITGTWNVNLSTQVVIGNLVFGDYAPSTAGHWVLKDQTLALARSSGTPSISVQDSTVTIGSAIEGTQGFNKQGDGTLLLPEANVYQGQTVVNGGALQVAHDAALGAGSGGTSIQNPATARLEVSGNIQLAEPLTVSCKGSALGNVPAIVNAGGTNTLTGPMTLTTGGSYWTIEAASGRLVVSGTVTNTTTSNVRVLWLRGDADGELGSEVSDSAGGFATSVRKDGAGEWTLSGENRYTGMTTVSNGTLRVSGAVAGPVAIYGSQLSGTGVIRGPVVVYSGGTFAPGPGPAPLTISNTLTLAPGSVTRMELGLPSAGFDRVRGLSHTVYGGTLVVTNVGGAFVPGQTFHLFGAMSAAGNFDAIAPAIPGPGLMWNFDPAAGTLSIVAVEPPRIERVEKGVDGSFLISGTGPSGGTYRVLSTTNLGLPVESWMPIETNVFTNGVFLFTEPEIPGSGARMFRVVSP